MLVLLDGLTVVLMWQWYIQRRQPASMRREWREGLQWWETKQSGRNMSQLIHRLRLRAAINGRFGKPAMQLLNALATKAVDGGDVIKGSFAVRALRELSVELCKGNGNIFRRELYEMSDITSTSSAGFTAQTNDVLYVVENKLFRIKHYFR